MYHENSFYFWLDSAPSKVTSHVGFTWLGSFPERRKAQTTRQLQHWCRIQKLSQVLDEANLGSRSLDPACCPRPRDDSRVQNWMSHQGWLGTGNKLNAAVYKPLPSSPIAHPFYPSPWESVNNALIKIQKRYRDVMVSHTHTHAESPFWITTSETWFLNIGWNRCRQYSLNRRVKISSGIVKPDAIGDFLNPKTPRAIICIRINETMTVLCIIGQNCPPLSYFGIYTLRIWNAHFKIQSIIWFSKERKTQKTNNYEMGTIIKHNY